MQTKRVKWGNSQGIRLPKYILDSVDLKDAIEDVVFRQNTTFIISIWLVWILNLRT